MTQRSGWGGDVKESSAHTPLLVLYGSSHKNTKSGRSEILSRVACACVTLVFVCTKYTRNFEKLRVYVVHNRFDQNYVDKRG